VIVVPIRHHSPAAALQVERLIRERRPRVVLVEGPSDATPLIEQLLDRASVPPLALYAYRRHGDDVRAVYYPFCAYSPEYVALKVGREVGGEVAFCDLPAAVTLEWEELDPKGFLKARLRPPQPPPHGDGEGEQVADGAAPLAYGRMTAALAEAAGFDDFEAFWEAVFEQEAGQRTPEGFIEALEAFGSAARRLITVHHEYDSRRERAMAAAARAFVEQGVPHEAVMLVCGAAHAQAIVQAYAADVHAEAPAAVSPDDDADRTVQIALIPYSYPRLSEQAGYGAGNRAPWYYQQVWELGGDYPAATRRALVLAARHLREQGYAASSAQAIDAYALAATLAMTREKLAPGVDELIDAAQACFGQGRGDVIGSAVRTVLIGDAIGRITGKAGRTPLQEEFYATSDRLRLPVLDVAKQILVHLAGSPVEAEQSVFLHRLAAIGVPYGHEIASGLGGRLAQGPLEQLGQVREKWELQWSPATDARLIERTAWGSTIAEACGRLLRERLDAAQRVDAGTEVLLQLALCDLTAGAPFDAALARCEALSADSGSFPALARATYHLDGLLGYGSARKLPAEHLLDLATRLFARAVLHLPAATICGDEAADEVRQTLLALHELVQRGGPVVRSGLDAFWEAITAAAERSTTHPNLRGLTLVLLELGGRLGPDELASRLRYWLSRGADAADNANLVAGLFALHRATLVRNRALIGAVTELLLSLELDQLTPLLPALRRGLGNLGGAERAYLSETLADVLGLEGRRASRALAVASTDRAWLREADQAVAATLATWKERYGIGA
jgi:hypothetical protein